MTHEVLKTSLDLATKPDVQTDKTLGSVFPFQKPPQKVIDSTYFIVDPELQLPTAFHQTSSSVLLFPRDDGRVLVPAVALGEQHPSMNLVHLMRETMYVTTAFARRWGVWMGRNILKFQPNNTDDYTPEKAEQFIGLTEGIRALYEQGFITGRTNRVALKERLGKVVQGYWLQYFSDDLPQRIEQGYDEQTRAEVDRLFAGFDNQVQRAGAIYGQLADNDRQLLDHSFNLIFEVSPAQPMFYITEGIPTILTDDYGGKATEQWRNPKEIAAEPRGVYPEDVKAVYLPDEVMGTQSAEVAASRLQQAGISPDKITTTSAFGQGAGVLDHCMLRYGNFSSVDLVEAIKQRRLVHILDNA